MRTQSSNSLLILTSVLLTGALLPVLANAKDTRSEPESATGYQTRPQITANDFMVVAANPYAAKAGQQILKSGGSAIDATIATQMVLNLVEPQSSGIGGGAFLLHWNAISKTLKSYDGRETAPQAATPERFLIDGVPMGFRDAGFGGLSVGTPGLLHVLKLAHDRHGKLPWKQLFTPAIKLASEGFKVSPRLNKLLDRTGPTKFGPQARQYFFDDEGNPWPIGHLLKNPAFAQTLQTIADKGISSFYEGKIAKDIVDKVRNSPGTKGDMTLKDLSTYRAVQRPSVCISYRHHKICGMGPPSSGALTIAQVLKLVEPFDLGKEPLNASALHLITEAEKLAYADRNRYMADPDFVHIPKGLLNSDYLAQRRKLIDPARAMIKATPGTPPKTKKSSYGRDATIENSGTSHISIIDKDGNAVSMTTTIESAFGANIMVGGFLLNNELTDFSFRPKDAEGRPIANRVEPGKRPRSSMSPTIVFDDNNNIEMLTGSPGGSRIILFVLKTLIAHIDWGLDAQQAASLPNFGSRNRPLEIEPDAVPEKTILKLQDLGHKIKTTPMTSGVHIIIRNNNHLEGGVDPRREGAALGQ